MKLSQFKVLTFDVVGTLIDFETGVLNAVRALGGPKAAAASDDEIFEPYKRGRDKFYGRSSFAMKDVYLSLAAERGFQNDEATAEAFQLAVLRWPAFADSVDALRRLRKNFRLVAMTNADRTAFSAYSATLENPFHDSVTCDETGCAKPDPRFFAFNKGRQSAHGFRQSEILHVAQSQYHDIGVAKAEGYTTCWIERRQGLKGFGGTPDPKVLTKPDFHFSTLKQLADAVDAELDTSRAAA
ncbi:putative hydrolase of the HAD superfamily [Xanthobacter flavus]|uniref:2-haloalkanoic acid dehalogenase n=1 Tax=Xanthobacter flavus TaxID=281 RepID=A0A9W6FII2_XANFL|nr:MULTISPECIES: HAD-IA family hydrolase [Xanthobacter]MDR6332918.1 putative hydrolase of the HAD superfamily [Xanthobacter flavus]UDQ87590.1 HAD-IA family hydrolase [Xanthobacter autotrophicus]GLI21196.1 2-haloalkanoic acid dehalogenase [Xanthobacter flavus]